MTIDEILELISKMSKDDAKRISQAATARICEIDGPRTVESDLAEDR